MSFFSSIPGLSTGINILGSALGWDAERKGYNAGINEYQTNLGPYVTAGHDWLKDLNALRSDPMSVTKLPGYQFRFDQGREAMENSAAARGDLLSGNTGKALTEYGQNYALDQYQNELANLLKLITLGMTSAGIKSGGISGLEVDKGKSKSGYIGDIFGSIGGLF